MSEAASPRAYPRVPADCDCDQAMKYGLIVGGKEIELYEDDLLTLGWARRKEDEQCS